MDQEKRPWYPWYPRDFEGDGPVKLMSLEAEACYRRLLDFQWLEGRIPADAKDQAKICKGIAPARMRKLWAEIAPCFVAHDETGKWLINRRLERVRVEQEEKHRERSASGKKGAEARWSQRQGDSKGDGSANGSAIGLPLAKPWQSESESEPTTPPNPPTPPTAAEIRQVSIDATVALNNGLKANPLLVADHLKTVRHDAQVSQVKTWLEAGIAPATIVAAVREAAERFKPKPDEPQIHSLTYCNRQVQRAHKVAIQNAGGGSTVFVEA